MSNATQTIAERFRAYENEALEQEIDRLSSEGAESGVIRWMEADAWRLESLREHFASLGHYALVARNDNARVEAIERMRKALACWASDYVDSWTDEQRIAFMHEHDRETALAQAMDREEGNDE